MVSISLVGLRGSGKTSTAIELAILLNRPFIDADTEFTRRYGPINEFVRRNDWLEFRKLESYILEDICSTHYGRDVILSTGGGAIAHDKDEKLRLKNVSLLRKLGTICYLLPWANLDESAKILFNRLEKDGVNKNSRPELNGKVETYESFLSMVKTRDPLYRDASDRAIFNYSNNPREVAKVITNLVLL